MNVRSAAFRLLVAAAGLMAAIAIWATGCGTEAEEAAGTDDAIEYRAADLRTGEAVSAEDLRGSPVLLVSWATWCKECDEELAGLQEFASSPEAEGIEIVAVNLDAGSVDDEIDAKIERHGLTTRLWRDRRNDYKRTFGALGVPTTVLLADDGSLIGTFPGAIDFEERRILEALERARSK